MLAIDDTVFMLGGGALPHSPISMDASFQRGVILVRPPFLSLFRSSWFILLQENGKIQAAAGPPTALSLHKFQEVHFIILNLVSELRSDKI